MEQGYVKAAILRGESGGAIILRELLPNVADLLTVEFALRASSALLLVSALSFLGLGLSPPIPDWGLMIHDGLQSIRSGTIRNPPQFGGSGMSVANFFSSSRQCASSAARSGTGWL